MVERDIVDFKLRITEDIVKRYVQESIAEYEEVAALDRRVKYASQKYGDVLVSLILSLKYKLNLTDHNFNECMIVWRKNSVRFNLKSKSNTSLVIKNKIYDKLEKMLDKYPIASNEQKKRIYAKWNKRNWLM